MREGEVCVNPSLIAFSEQIVSNFLQSLLEVVDSFSNAHFIAVAQHSHCLHLMKNWVVKAVDFVSSVNIAKNYKIIDS